MKDGRFGVDGRSVPLLVPQDIAATATTTAKVDLKGVLHAKINAYFGNIAAASADQAVVVTLVAATSAATTSEVTMAFSYRLSGATGTDTWGDISSATSTGVSIGTTDDNKILSIDINPVAVAAALAGAQFVGLVITPDAGGTATLVSAWADIEPVYASVLESSAS